MPTNDRARLYSLVIAWTLGQYPIPPQTNAPNKYTVRTNEGMVRRKSFKNKKWERWDGHTRRRTQMAKGKEPEVRSSFHSCVMTGLWCPSVGEGSHMTQSF